MSEINQVLRSEGKRETIDKFLYSKAKFICINTEFMLADEILKFNEKIDLTTFCDESRIWEKDERLNVTLEAENTFFIYVASHIFAQNSDLSRVGTDDEFVTEVGADV